MKRTVAVVAALTLMLFLTACATQADVDEAYNSGYRHGYDNGNKDGYEAAKKEWVGYYSQIAYAKGYTAGNQDAILNINTPNNSFKEFNESDEATVYDDPLAEVEREMREAYKNGYNDGECQSGIKYVEEVEYKNAYSYYSSNRYGIDDGVYDEIYEMAYQDGYGDAKSDIRRDFDIDLDY